jgi:hypothetical protein
MNNIMKKTILILASLISLNLSAQDTTHPDTCIVTVYDTITYTNIEWVVEAVVMDTFTVYKIEWIQRDTCYTQIYDTVQVRETIFDTVTVYETVYDTVVVYYDDPLSIDQQTFQPERVLVKTVNLNGQIVTNRPRNTVLIDVYSDGSFKKYVIR